jgi:hypothetical protein
MTDVQVHKEISLAVSSVGKSEDTPSERLEF